MKKMYGTPKAERVEFDYSDAVVASDVSKCRDITPYTQALGLTPPCNSVVDGPTTHTNEIG